PACPALRRVAVDVPRQNFALADVVGRPHHALHFHALDDLGGAIVADAEMALDEAGRCLALASDDCDALVVELVVLRLLLAAARAAHVAGLAIVDDIVDVGRPRLRPQVLDHTLHLTVAHERAVHPRNATAARHVEHVALPEELLAA